MFDRALYDRFDKPFDRLGTESLKWDARKDFGNADAISGRSISATPLS